MPVCSLGGSTSLSELPGRSVALVLTEGSGMAQVEFHRYLLQLRLAR